MVKVADRAPKYSPGIKFKFLGQILILSTFLWFWVGKVVATQDFIAPVERVDNSASNAKKKIYNQGGYKKSFDHSKTPTPPKKYHDYIYRDAKVICP